MKVLVGLLVAALVSSRAPPANSGWGPERVAQHSGYITVDRATDSGSLASLDC